MTTTKAFNQKLIKQIGDIVKRACYSENNAFGAGVWDNHIVSVMMYADALAVNYGADREVCALAALLHDYAGIYDYKYYADHHIHGAKAARYLLAHFNYPAAKIEMVADAILTHRATKKYQYNSIEGEILANADAMAHFFEYQSLVDYATEQRKLSPLQSNQFVRAKIERSYLKMSPAVRKMVMAQYQLIDNRLRLAS